MNCPPQLRSAIASLDGIEPADVVVHYGNKTAVVSLGPGDPTPEAIVERVDGTRFGLTKAN